MTLSYHEIKIPRDFSDKFEKFSSTELLRLANDFYRMTMEYSSEEQIYIRRLADAALLQRDVK